MLLTFWILINVQIQRRGSRNSDIRSRTPSVKMKVLSCKGILFCCTIIVPYFMIVFNYHSWSMSLWFPNTDSDIQANDQYLFWYHCSTYFHAAWTQGWGLILGKFYAIICAFIYQFWPPDQEIDIYRYWWIAFDAFPYSLFSSLAKSYGTHYLFLFINNIIGENVIVMFYSD